MAKPLSLIVGAMRVKRLQDEFDADCWQFLSALERVYVQVGSHADEIARLAAKRGLDPIMARLRSYGMMEGVTQQGEQVTVDMNAVCDSAAVVLGVLIQAWGASSDYEIPALPLNPVIPELPTDPEPTPEG